MNQIIVKCDRSPTVRLFRIRRKAGGWRIEHRVKKADKKSFQWIGVPASDGELELAVRAIMRIEG